MPDKSERPDQHSMVLQLLRAERIPLAEAEALMRLLEEDAESGRDAYQHAANGGADLPFHPGSVASRIRGGLSGIENAVRQTLYTVDVQGAIDQALSYTHATSEGRVSYVLGGTETRLVVDNPWGDVVLSGGSGATELRVVYRVAALAPQQRSADHNAKYTRVAVEQFADALHIVVTPPGDASIRSMKVDLAVELPTAFGAYARSLCGDFTAAALSGTVEFDGRIGDIVLQRLSGEVNARTALGDVSAFVCPERRAALSVRGGRENIRIEVPAGKLTGTAKSLYTTLYETAQTSGRPIVLGTEGGNVRVTAV